MPIISFHFSDPIFLTPIPERRSETCSPEAQHRPSFILNFELRLSIRAGTEARRYRARQSSLESDRFEPQRRKGTEIGTVGF